MKKFCVIGNPVTHSKSPEIYKYIFNILNINAQYSMQHIESDKAFKKFILETKMYYSGYNITAPFKDLAYSLVDEIHETVPPLTSINCIQIKDEKLIGYNTDYYGFKMLMNHQSNMNMENKNFLILGNGSTARTISVVLNNLYNTEIYVWGRNSNNVQSFIKSMNDESFITSVFHPYNKNKNKTYTLINCLPINISQDDINNIFNSILFKNIELLIDVNYVNNKLIDSLFSMNIKSIFGHDMLLYQALKNLDIWFDINKSSKIDFTTFKNNIFIK